MIYYHYKLIDLIALIHIVVVKCKCHGVMGGYLVGGYQLLGQLP